MNIYLITPNPKNIKPDHLAKLNQVGKVSVISNIKPLIEVSELFLDTEPKIVAIDPDFCEWKFPNNIIEKIPNLKAICLQTTSFSWIDVEFCTEKNIPVTNLRGFSSIAVAEWATAMTLMIARRIPIVIKDGWKLDYEKHKGIELRGKSAGVIGLGRIGTTIAENLNGLGLNVQYWSKNTVDERYKKLSLPDLLSTSDVLVSAVAHNAETERLLDEALLKSMKSTCLFIDIAHPIYDTELMLSLAAENKIGGYAFEDEKNKFGHYEGNVWNGPAIGWCTNESMSKNIDQWAESIIAASTGEFPTKVND